ncbi:GGDEF domain-containing protein, partial [bacterium]|nr:GGDEF domain-containing protein [bacterium]
MLLRLTTRDHLTGLPNRALLLDRLSHAMGAARRRNRSVGVLFIDIDRFKLINDSLGHDVGDTLLKRLAETIGRAIRIADTFGRLGGDEFLVIAEDLLEPQDAARIAMAILDAVCRPFVIDGQSLFAALSIGIAISRGEADDATALLRFADTAMQAAKAGGGGGYRFFMPEMNAEAL